MDIKVIKNFLQTWQNQLCETFEKEAADHKFKISEWQRKEGGGGQSRIIEGDSVLERVGVNFSHIFGDSIPPAATQSRPELVGCPFEAMGVSVVVHPNNPFVPTTHANIRFFTAQTKNNGQIWWFGGGFDLTPYYPFVEDCIHWHQAAKDACTPFGNHLYPKFKKWCDEYFFLKHRNEPRGIGGLFFDDFNELGFEDSFSLIKRIAQNFLLAYIPIFQKRKQHLYGTQEKAFQSYRRGRYVEFNLLYDRGTLFGLQSGGRTESILMSLPPVVHWQYDWQPEPHSEEAKLYEDFLLVRDWVS